MNQVRSPHLKVNAIGTESEVASLALSSRCARHA